MTEQDLEYSLIREKLNKDNFVEQLLVLDEVDSTNDFLKREADNLQTPALAVAKVQTAGKGSKGRSWSSAEGSAIFMSLLIRPDIQMFKAPMLTLVTAVSVAETCRSLYNLPIQIKWPNDIICNGKKVCGILTEMKQSSSGNYSVVIGMGLNVNTENFPEELQEKATSIYKETGKKWQRFDLIGKIMECFSENYKLFLQKSDLSLLLNKYNKMSATIGKEVLVLDLKGKYRARALKVCDDGSLTIQCEDGQTKNVFGDEVSVRGIYGYVPDGS